MVEKYLELQTRLYELNPSPPKRNQRGKVNTSITLEDRQKASVPGRDRKILRLTSRLNQITSDVLFDEAEAKQRWQNVQIDLFNEAAERKRMGIVDGSKLSLRGSVRPLPSESNEMPHNAESDDTDDMMDGLFDGLPDIDATDAGKLSAKESSGKTVEIRDFGKWTGLSPRRVFEEAIRSRWPSSQDSPGCANIAYRDSSAKVSYTLISSSTFSKRHALQVAWSRSQEELAAITIPSLSLSNGHRSTKFTMDSIACPDASQSEGYISTVGLFWIFSSSAKEEKAYLRLPATWKDLWSELADMKRDQESEQDRAVLQEIRTLMDEFESSKDSFQDHGSKVSDDMAAANKSGHVENETTLQLMSSPIADMQAIWQAKESTAAYQNMIQSRKSLPIWAFKADLLDAIEHHQVIIVCGETGCGKSTQGVLIHANTQQLDPQDEDMLKTKQKLRPLHDLIIALSRT